MADEAVIAMIRALHVKRRYYIAQRLAAEARLMAFLRTQLGWRLDLPSEVRKRIEKDAISLAGDWQNHPRGAEFVRIIEATRSSAAPFDAQERELDRMISAEVAKLPIAAWWQANVFNVLGSLGSIIGEAGDLSNYSNPAKLWKRMGLGVIEGRRQGAPGKDATADDWIAHGYSPARRAVMWNIAASLVRKKSPVFYPIYIARKEYELPRRATKKHADNCARRYMEKQLLVMLWNAWRAAEAATFDGEALGVQPTDATQKCDEAGASPAVFIDAAVERCAPC